MFPKKLRIRQKQSWDKLPVHNLVYRNDQDNIKWSVLKLDNTKAKCTQSFFFQPTILFKFISNATIYLTPKMFISIINTEGCFFFNQNSFYRPLCLQCSPCLGIMGLRFSPPLKGFPMLKSANHLPFLNAQKQCLIKISFNLKTFCSERKTKSPVGTKRCKTWISVTEKNLCELLTWE